jgi:hypothetical protein
VTFENEFETVAPPEITVQLPLPTEGRFALIVPELAQMVWLLPVDEAEGFASLETLTTADVAGQLPLETVQENKLVPTESEFATAEASVGLLIDAVPETTVHEPVPIAGAVAAS